LIARRQASGCYAINEVIDTLSRFLLWDCHDLGDRAKKLSSFAL
jgi:hypothetical protein